MTVYLRDADFTLHVGDVRETLSELAADSVDMVCTSPPYWGLRDYGTAEWEGGDPGCDHNPQKPDGGQRADRALPLGRGGVYRDVCGECGAVRADRQLGLEATPQEYVQNLVDVFREVRRVLAPHGTVWLNLGDSYNAAGRIGHGTRIGAKQGTNRASADGSDWNRPSDSTLKEKDLVGIPWRTAFALQDDGWYLRSDIIWAKPNPMPESVTDRPTKSHEYVFLLSKQPFYYFDQEAVREPAAWERWGDQTNQKYDGVGTTGWIGSKSKEELQKRATTWEERKAGGASSGSLTAGQNSVHGDGVSHDLGDPAKGRNIRSVWTIATHPYKEAHFATFPEELPRRAIMAGCPEQVCRTCGKPRERIVEREPNPMGINGGEHREPTRDGALGTRDRDPEREARIGITETTGWTDCGHDNYRSGVVLDTFMGAGTTALVARKLGRHAVGVELNPDYCEIIATRLQQQSLFA